MANKRFAIKCSRSTFFIAAYAFLLILTSTFFLRLLLKEAIRMAQLPSDAGIVSVVPPSQSREEIDVYVLAIESLIPKNQKRMGTLNRFIYRVCTNEFRIKYKCCTIQLCVFAPLWLFFFRAILLSLNFLFSLYFIYLPL